MRSGEALVALSEYAADQWGMVTAAQATAIGVGTVVLTRLAEAKLLEHVGHGVYALPATDDAHRAEKVAWLRLAPARPGWEREPLDDDGGVVSHRSAAAVHELGDLVTAQVEITTPRRRATRDPGVRLRRAELGELDVTRIEGLPVTTAERTVLDLLADHVDGEHVGNVLADATRRDLVDLDRLAERVAPYARAYGITRGRNRGRALLGHLLEHSGHGRGEQARLASSVAEQLAGLDTEQLTRLSEIVRRIADT